MSGQHTSGQQSRLKGRPSANCAPSGGSERRTQRAWGSNDLVQEQDTRSAVELDTTCRGGGARRGEQSSGFGAHPREETAQAPATLRSLTFTALPPEASAVNPSRTIAGMRLTRLARIVTVAIRHGLDEFAARARAIALASAVRQRARCSGATCQRRAPCACASRWRSSGPIFVKFGQMLSTRRDLLPPDIADELAKLQDRVPPFPSDAGRSRRSTRVYGKPVDQVFKSFDRDADRERIGRAGAFRRAARRHAGRASRCCGPTSAR